MDLSGLTQQRMLGESADRCLEKFIHADGSERVVPGYVRRSASTVFAHDSH